VNTQINKQITIDQPYEIGHRATEGHFADHPIIPGVVILADVMRAFRKQNAHQNMLSSHYTIRAAKFLRPVLPGQTMTISLKIAAMNVVENRLAVSFECAVADAIVAKGSLDFYGRE
jgi:3-hydroxymyristoyl/3-hydroxydecanoyl-(acyl carrier protein) dehydratase